MRDLISGKKKFIDCDKIKFLYVPQYESLKIALIMAQALSIPEAMNHLPILKEIEKVPKAWLCTIIYSVVGKQFAGWVQERIGERNEKVTVIRDLNINIDPKVLAAFNISNAVSM